MTTSVFTQKSPAPSYVELCADQVSPLPATSLEPPTQVVDNAQDNEEDEDEPQGPHVDPEARLAEVVRVLTQGLDGWFPDHRMAAIAALAKGGLDYRASQFCGGLVTLAGQPSRAQAAWLQRLLERAKLPTYV